MKKILGLLTGLILTGCITIKPVGHIDIAYIPQRTDDKIMKNEIMTELDVGLEAKIVEGRLKNAKIRIGGRQRTYSTPESFFSFNPNRQEYDFYTNIKYKNLEIYTFHMCSHPVDYEIELVKDSKENWRILNADSLTKFGLKLEF